jgi:hypothetical protein
MKPSSQTFYRHLIDKFCRETDKDGRLYGDKTAASLQGEHVVKPFTAAGFSHWFRTRCNEAGLPQCSAHGLRKAAARRLADGGCTGTRSRPSRATASLREIVRYTKAADQQRLARAAMEKMSAKQEQKLSNLGDGLTI